MKKILLLGGSAQQTIAIEKAKKLGLYTILCDFLPNNPGQYLADKFYPASTTDKEEILNIAQAENIDGILAYASDPAAATAAFVSEKLSLPGNPYESVEILCNKDKFRKFLFENHFFTPKANSYDNIEMAIRDIDKYTFPIMIKPIDSSGSKGVARVDTKEELYEKFDFAMSFSRKKCVIIEEWIDKYGYQVAGDGLSIDGKLIFRCFGNDHFNPDCANPFVPVSASFPYHMPSSIHKKIHDEIQRLITLLNMKTCTYNFDVRVDTNMNVYLMEVAPRDGGNYIPQIIEFATGVDLAECSIKAAIGETIILQKNIEEKGYFSYYAVHSIENGILKNINISKKGQAHIIENHITAKSGDLVKSFERSDATLGILLMKFDSMEQMLDMMDHSKSWINIELEKEV